ncbi:hypothetical protein ABRP57_09625 [Pectobacterium aroidearum]|uniref:hypothetical protein n=1 Tax=Pectobacterium aroidearum TaxID=1201031 RepID=UPI0032EAD38B
MFTVKQIINNSTSLYEVESFHVARSGSEQWRQAFELADKLEVANPDTLEFIFPTYGDPEMTKVITEESYLSVERSGCGREACIAVICSGVSSAAFPNIPDGGGVGYQFIYHGDQLYVTNSHGATIETVK